MRRLSVLLCAMLLVCAVAVPLRAESSAQPYGDAIRVWLSHHQHKATGLVQSFASSDPALRYQASTYDQALAGMAFLATNDVPRARRVLEFFATHWDGQGFANFYHARTGRVGIETTVHVGPNAWVGLLALAYEVRTGDRRYHRLAESIALWIAELPHRQGGVAMGPRADWGANWPTVFSSENNLSYLALLDALSAVRGDASKHAVRLEAERAGVLQFLRDVTFKDLDAGRVNSGVNDRGIDATQAFDVIPMALLIVGPERLRAMGVDPLQLVACAERTFGVEHAAVHGFDFTDQAGALGAKRGRMVSVEWSSMMVRAYRHLAQDITGQSAGSPAPDAHTAHALLAQAALVGEGLDRLRMAPLPEAACYPYATRAKSQVFPFAPWWKTPAPGPDGLACSVSGTVWRYFAERGNPFEWN